MSWAVPEQLDAEIDELMRRYPQKRSASLMVLHAVQRHFGWISREAVEHVAARLELQPINIYELVTFYPMFRQEPAGTYQLKICRTLSCALAGSGELHRRFCERLGLDPKRHGVQTTEDGRFSVEFVECLAGCDRAPTMMCNDEYYELLTPDRVEEVLQGCAGADVEGLDEVSRPGERKATKSVGRRKKE